MIAVPAPYPSWLVDCDTTLTAQTAAGLRAAGAAGVLRYLGALSPTELALILDAGLLCGLVTFADQWDPASVRAELQALGVPQGVCVAIDVESVHETADVVASRIDACSAAIASLGLLPALYVGADQPLDAAQLYARQTVRYWRSMSLVPEPRCGYSLAQGPTTVIAGVKVDIDYPRPDYYGRTWMLIGHADSVSSSLSPVIGAPQSS